ncbi:MAG: 30S ribosomal protein S7 [Candidatus Aureabacteria bacterium]|nr:30S ribosomal protein S7 [Candidatus Auribacterota bacterium]
MSRRRGAIKRPVSPDPIYNHYLVNRFINVAMIQGEKAIAEKIVYSALDMLSEKTKETGLSAFEKALSNVRPLLEVKSRRVGGATYQVPMEVTTERGNALAMRWIVWNARKRGTGSFKKKLANELLDAFNNTGISVKKREETHKMAEANRAFAHYRW